MQSTGTRPKLDYFVGIDSIQEEEDDEGKGEGGEEGGGVVVVVAQEEGGEEEEVEKRKKGYPVRVSVLSIDSPRTRIPHVSEYFWYVQRTNIRKIFDLSPGHLKRTKDRDSCKFRWISGILSKDQDSIHSSVLLIYSPRTGIPYVSVFVWCLQGTKISPVSVCFWYLQRTTIPPVSIYFRGT